MAMVALNANAQLKVEKETKHSETISSYYVPDAPGAAQLKYDTNNNCYYMTIVSFNQFDDLFLFYLGDDKEKARQTLLDLEGLYKLKKVTTTVKNYGEKCDIRRHTGIKLLFSERGYAGDVFLYKDAVKKFINAIDTKL